jgi:hypothetical protein
MRETLRRWVWPVGSLAVATMATALAQPPEGPGGPEGRGGPPGGPPPSPIVEVLDADHDHVISADELKKASEMLAKLDKNKDGKLTEDEFRPMRRGREGGGPEGPPPGGPRGEGRPPQGRGPGGERPEGRGPEGRGPGGPDGPDGPPMGPDPKRMVEHAMEFDADKDGKLSKAELLKFAEDFASHHPGPGGPRGPGGGGRGPGGRPMGPGAGPPMGPGGEGRPTEGTPERPRRPE